MTETSLAPISGVPEGREGVWLITPATAEALIEVFPWEEVHCFLGMIGADWKKSHVLDLIHRPDVRIALLFPPNVTMRHHLVVLDSEYRRSFDIGAMSESRMVKS